MKISMESLTKLRNMEDTALLALLGDAVPSVPVQKLAENSKQLRQLLNRITPEELEKVLELAGTDSSAALQRALNEKLR